MASPQVVGSSSRILDPHKPHKPFNLQISDRIAKPDTSLGDFSSFKFNHKPKQTSEARTTTLTSDGNAYTLTLDDGDENSSSSDIYTFRGSRRRPKQSYVLILDPSKQTCKLEPLSASYTFNLKSMPSSSKQSSEQYQQIYPQKTSTKSQEDPADLFNEDGHGDVSDSEPEADNPYDYRHFLTQQKRSDAESDFPPSSPDFRAASAANTPLVNAKKSANAIPTTKAHARAPAPATRKRKSPEPSGSSTIKGSAPTVRLDRRASTRPTEPATSKATRRAPPPKPESKIKSAEIIHDSSEEESDADAESDHDNDATLTIEVPDAHPPRGKPKGALASLGLGQNLGLGNRGFLKSPSNGPISLHSAANSVEGSPAITPNHRTQSGGRKPADEDVIDFGDFGARSDDEDDDMGYVQDNEEEEDRDVEPMDIGPPANQPSSRNQGSRMSGSGLGIANANVEAEEEDEDDDADFAAELMQGLVSQEDEMRAVVDEDESEESEEE